MRKGQFGHAGQRYSAFTMIEVLVVLVILAVAAGLIVPRMGRSIEGQELREAAARFAHTARTVRELAVSTRKTAAIEIDLDRGAYSVTVLSSQASGGRMQAVQASWLKQGRWPATVRVSEYQTPTGSGMSVGVQRLEFLPDGTSSGAFIRLSSDADEYSIVVRPHNGQVVLGDADTHPFMPDQYDLGD